MSKMQELQEYVEKYAVRGECCCGKCIDAVEKPEDKQPAGHTADMVFFKVAAAEGADAVKLKELVTASVGGSHCDVDLFDGNEHGYMELGGWMGDQGAALMLMGLGTVLGLWELMTPVTILKLAASDPLAQKMAGAGYVTVKAKQGG